MLTNRRRRVTNESVTETEAETKDELLAIRVPRSLVNRIRACMGDLRVANGVPVSKAATVRALLEEALAAREGRSGA